MAWLSDQVPEKFQGLVHIVRAGEEAAIQNPPDIDTIAGSVAVLATQAEKNEAVRIVLRNLAAAFSGEAG